MNWTKSLHNVAKMFKCSISVFCKCQNSTLNIEKNFFASLQADRGCVCAGSLQQAGFESEYFQDTLKSKRDKAWRVKLPCGLSSNISAQRKYAMLISCQYSHSTSTDPDLSREFFVKLWMEDKKCFEVRERQTRPQFHAEESYTEMNPFLGQAPTSQSLTGALTPSSPEEAKVAPLLARSHLLITRDIEWANIVAALEQESRYLIVDLHYPKTVLSGSEVIFL